MFLGLGFLATSFSISFLERTFLLYFIAECDGGQLCVSYLRVSEIAFSLSSTDRRQNKGQHKGFSHFKKLTLGHCKHGANLNAQFHILTLVYN